VPYALSGSVAFTPVNHLSMAEKSLRIPHLAPRGNLDPSRGEFINPRAACGDDDQSVPISGVGHNPPPAMMLIHSSGPASVQKIRFLVRADTPQGRPLRELGNNVGVSALERHGFVRVIGGKRSEIVILTPKGHAASEAYGERVRVVEADWRDRFGDENVASLRRALADVGHAQGR